MNNCIARLFITGVLLLAWADPARANVYATNVRLNGSIHNCVILTNASVTISYILNEAATAGAVLKILNGTNVVRSFSAAPGAPGSLRGVNSYTWDGLDEFGTNVSEGTYTISITAAALGYDSWTQITKDSDAGNFIYDPYGIAVNRNTNSPYYGRVFVGNAMSRPVAGQSTGIYILNSDGTFADEGGFSTGDYPWQGYMTSPWKMEVSVDDLLYVSDWSSYGAVMAFDQNVSTNYLAVLNDSNWPISTNGFNANLSGLAVTGSGTNTQIWMADMNTNGSCGILRWKVTSDGTLAPGDAGTVAVAAGPGTDLPLAPWDVAVDKNGTIYTIQRVSNPDNPACRVFRFPPCQGTVPQTNADWKIGGADALSVTNSPTNQLSNIYGIAVNTAASLLAVSARGGDLQNGGLIIISAATGEIVSSVSTGVDKSYIDVAWDNVGNVYGTEEEVWRAFSPPGPNQATTVAVPHVQVVKSLVKPVLSDPQATVGQVQFTISGQGGATYLVEASSNLTDWTGVATNYSLLPERVVQLTPVEDCNFYRVRLIP